MARGFARMAKPLGGWEWVTIPAKIGDAFKWARMADDALKRDQALAVVTKSETLFRSRIACGVAMMVADSPRIKVG